MYRMRHALVVVSIVPLLFFSFAHAQSSVELQAQLNALLAQLAALQAQLGGTVTAPTPTPTPTPTYGGTGACPQLYRTLRMGVSGSDVSALQAFLASDLAVYPEAEVTGYFGMLTQNAVQRFQGKHGIVSSGSPDSTGFGAVGPATRATIAALCRGGAPTPVPTIPGGCSLGGISVPAGANATFYSTTQAPLGSSCGAYAALRQCVNGSFSGNAAYQFRSCVESEASSCAVDGERVAHGTSFTFYSKRTVDTVGETCSKYAQTRTCTNGSLSGSTDFRYLSCKVEARDSCSLGGVTILDGQSRTFYRYDAATSTNSCSAFGQSRTCNDGTLSGSDDYKKISCTAGACLLDGVTYAHGSSSTFYFAQNIPANEQCSSYGQTRACSSGTFSGNSAYKYRTCAPVSGNQCALDNVVISSGASASFYSAANAPAGQSCAGIRQTRTCTNGVLSGNAGYNRASCSDTASCSLDGVSVTHGETYRFYSARTVTYGSTCSSVSLVRTCTNGALSGSASYQYGSCTVNPPTSSLPNTAQLANALAALESLLKGALLQLDSWF